MASLPLSDFHDLWVVKGAGSSVADQAAGARDLALTGSGTAPRSKSYRGRRGAEFRASGFAATAPRAFATDSPGTLSASLYVSNKVKSFTLFGWFRPQKTGATGVALTPVGGLFSATNMGGTPWLFNHPCLIATPAAAGGSRLVVSIFGSVLDTRDATQTVGPADTAPVDDNDWNFVAVRVTGSTTTNNQVDAVDVLHMTRDGVVRVYTLGERKASAALYLPTNPTDGQTVTIEGRVYTFKASLVGTPAEVRYNSSGSNASDGDTLTIGQEADGTPIVYTLRNYIGAGQAATQALEINASASPKTSLYKTRVQIGGWIVTLLWGAKNADGYPAGGFSITNGPADNVAFNVFKAWHGDMDGLRDLKIPAPPATGEYDAGRSWQTRRVWPGTASSLLSDYVSASLEVPLRALDVGSGGNAVKVAVLEPDTAGDFTLPVDAARSGRNTTWQVRLKAVASAVAASNSGAGSVANGTYKYAVTFVHASGETPPNTALTHVVSGGPRAVDLSSIPLGPTGTTARRVYRTKAGASTYYLLTTISDNTTTTYSDTTADGSLSTTTMPTSFYMSGGLSAAGSRTILIGATPGDTKSNIVKAVNATGVAGTDYSSDITTANPTWTAAVDGSDIVLTSKHAGSAGNGKPASESSAAFSSVSVDTVGVDGGTADQVLIGADAQESLENLVDALNLEGAQGIVYGDPTTLNADVSATAETGRAILESKASGASGNSCDVSSTVTGAYIRDEYGDKTITQLVGGQAAPPFAVASGARPDQTDLRFVWGGWVGTAPATTTGIFYGMVSDCGLANRVLTQEECQDLGFTPPPVSSRDRGWYRAAHRVRVAFKTDRHSDWPLLRSLATGAASQRLPLAARGQRGAARIVGIDPGRPWAVDRVELEADGEAGIAGSGRIPILVPAISKGLNRAAPPTKVDPRATPNAKNISYFGGYPRRRRGYAILSNESTSTAAASCAFWDATNAAGDIYQLALVEGVLYQFDNGELIELDSGWPQDEIPTVATIGLKTFILSKSRRKVFIQGSILDLGVEAPDTAPSFVSATANVTGGVVALTPGYEYVYTFFDGTKLTESGPSPVTLVVLPSGSSPSGINLSVPISDSSYVTKRVVYRRKRGTETWFKVGEISDNTSTDFADEAEVPETADTLEQPGGLFVTAEFPSASSCVSHEGRLVVYRDDDDSRSVWISEVGDGERFHLYNLFTADGEMRAAASHDGRLILHTDRTVEVMEGDWVRGSSGLLGVSRRVLDGSKSCFGPHAAASGRGIYLWADQNGVHTLGGSLDTRDTTRTLSDWVHPTIRQAVDTAGSRVVLAFNPVAQEAWLLLSRSNPGEEQDPKNRLALTLNLETGQWSEHDLALSWATKVVDGVFGLRFIGCDYFGTIVELEVYDGDGLQGNEASVPASKVTTAVDLTEKSVTIGTATFATDGSLRGVGVVLEDVSSGAFHRAIVLSNTSTKLVLSSVPSWLVVGDEVTIGGILGLLDTRDHDAGRAGEKVFRALEMSFPDSTAGDY